MRPLATEQDVHQLLYASTGSAALGAAIETGLLWMLADKPSTGVEVVQALRVPAKRCHYWLQLLCALGILETTDKGYKPSAIARSAILEVRSQASWRHLMIDERERTAGVHNLAAYFSEPGSIWLAQGLTEPKHYVEKMRRSPERARDFTRMLFEVHQYLGQELAALLDLSDVGRLMDLGGNSGVVSMALLEKYPAMSATVVDIENVCLAGREIAVECWPSDRLTYFPAEFDTDEFPAGFDVVLKCDVSIFSQELFRKVWASLNSGGRFILVDHFSPAEEIAPPKLLEWSFIHSLDNPEFAIPTVFQVRAQLVESGFQLIPGEQTLSDQRVVIQAKKQ